MIAWFLIACGILLLFALFVSPRLSPVPYFPSNKKDLPLILKALRLRDNQTIMDLGAGDGLVIFEAAAAAYRKGLSTKFIAVEINPVLILIMRMRRLFHPNRGNIRIVHADMFAYDFRKLRTTNHELPTFYLYISPRLLKKAIVAIKQSYNKFDLVSYYYSLPESIRNRSYKKYNGVHSIFYYRFGEGKELKK